MCFILGGFFFVNFLIQSIEDFFGKNNPGGNHQYSERMHGDNCLERLLKNRLEHFLKDIQKCIGLTPRRITERTPGGIA